METEPPSPQNDSPEPEPTIPDGENPDRSADAPASNPERSAADIPPPQRSGYISSERSYYSGLALRCAQNRAIRQWHGPRYPDHVLAATRLRTFCHAKWVNEGKPSREALADAGFYYDGESHIFVFAFFGDFIYFLNPDIGYSLILGWSDMCLFSLFWGFD
jgi:hypothetical protein